MKPLGFSEFLNLKARLGRPFGIPTYVHITILLFLLWVWGVAGALGWALGLEWALLIVLSIYLHELGHALAAKRNGMSGLSITLHGFGGFAMSSGPRTWKQSLMITLAGPAATFLLAAVGWGAFHFLGDSAEPFSIAHKQFILFGLLGTLNLWMGLLNMLPVLPWDGGNALQAILAGRFGEYKATRYAAHLGLPIAAALAIYAFLFSQLFLLMFGIVGLFSCYSLARSSGGIRFGEYFADRKSAKESAALKRRSEEKHRTYLEDVQDRANKRAERERLKKLFEDSLGED